MKKISHLLELLILIGIGIVIWFLLSDEVSNREIKTSVETESQTIQARIDARCDVLERKLDTLDIRLNAIDSKLNTADSKLDRLLDLAIPKLQDGLQPVR